MQPGAAIETDILVVGGTASGCCAAIAAAQSGARVVILEPTRSIGGVTANGVHCFDAGSHQTLSGAAEEFTRRVRRHYEETGLDDPLVTGRQDVFWEFHVAERIWRAMLAEQPGITLLEGAVPVAVVMVGNRVEAVQWEPAVDAIGNPLPEAASKPNQVRAKVVIDATYEGDVAAWSGAPFDLGREARSDAEPHAGVIFTASHERHIDRNGYLPSTILPGSSGRADDGIMAFTSRLSLRYYASDNDPDYRLTARPDGYDPGRYAWTKPEISPAGVPVFGFDLIPTVAGKMLLNQREKGNDLRTGTRDYILAHPRERAAIRKRFYDHILGFLHFIQNEGGTPQLALARDEYAANENVPLILYVREGRRFRGRARLTETNINPFLAGPGPRPPPQANSIAIGDWAIESRPCSDERDPATGAYEGAILTRALRAPYQVPFGCLTPEGIDNLLVTTTISASHVAFCALRIEAVWTGTGTAAGLAAAAAIRSGCCVADVPVPWLQDQMLQRGNKLTYFSDLGSDHRDFAGVHWLALKGFVPADRRFRFFPDASATWADLVEAAVLAFSIPVSVTGMHFEGLHPEHPGFRHAETLYDLASRSGIALFPNMRHPVIDAPADYLRPEPRTRWLDLQVDGPVPADAAALFLSRLMEALGRAPLPPGRFPGGTEAITRGSMATMLRSVAT